MEETQGVMAELVKLRDDVERIRRWELHASSAARVYNDADLTIGTASVTALTFNSERWDEDGMHDGTNPSRLTAIADGWYMIAGHVSWDAGGTGRRLIQIRLDGATNIASQDGTGVSGAAYYQSVATLYYLAADQYVELVAYQNDGGDLKALTQGNRSPEFAMGMV